MLNYINKFQREYFNPISLLIKIDIKDFIVFNYIIFNLSIE